MKNPKRIILISILIFALCTQVGSGETAEKIPEERILHFPKDRSLGVIKVLDADIKRQIQISHYDSFDYVGGHDWFDWMNTECFSEAQGDIAIPAGKKVALFLYENASEDLSPLLNLEPNDLHTLSHILLNWYTNIPLTDKNMQHISHLADLKELRLFHTTAGPGSLKHLSKLQSLEMLQTPKGLTNTDLSYIAQLKSLKRLNFSESRFTNAGLKRCLGHLTKLEELSLGQVQTVNDACLACLAALPRLQYLTLRSGNFTDAGMAHVKKCSSLRILDLMHLPITDAGLQRLSGHSKLESLLLYNTQVTDQGLVFLKSMPSLKKLHIGKRDPKPQITDAGMVHIAHLKSLEYLSLPGGITDKGAAQIAKLKNLKHLWGGGDSDAALQQLSKLQSLEYLLIGGSDITDAGMEDLAKLTNLEELNISLTGSITNKGLAKLKTLKSLERISLNGKNITSSTLSYLNELKNLSRIDLRNYRRSKKEYIKRAEENIIQDNSGIDISGLVKLEELLFKVDAPPTCDEDLVCLKKLKNLRLLVIGGGVNSSIVTDAGIGHLKDLPNMRELYCRSPYLTDKSLSYLANMKTLNFLTIIGKFTDEGLVHLEGLKNLRYLKIAGESNFSSGALIRLKKKLPNLYTLNVNNEDFRR